MSEGRKRGPRLRRWWGDADGATAAEFALTLAATITLTLGVINLAIVIYSYAALQSATQMTARWAAIQAATGAPTDAAAVQAHGSSVLRGGARGVLFTAQATACGVQVGATGSVPLLTGFGAFQVPLSAQACAAGG